MNQAAADLPFRDHFLLLAIDDRKGTGPPVGSQQKLAIGGQQKIFRLAISWLVGVDLLKRSPVRKIRQETTKRDEKRASHKTNRRGWRYGQDSSDFPIAAHFGQAKSGESGEMKKWTGEITIEWSTPEMEHPR